MTEDNDWDLEIRPHSAFFNLQLADVWRYRDLLWLFVKRDFTAQYKQTVLGPLWHFIQPLFTTIVFLVIFTNIAGISTDGLPPVLFYMTGITIWNYFSACLTATSNTFVANAAIFGKVYFPRLVLPLSVVFSNLVKFGIQFLLLTAAIVWYKFNGMQMEWGWRLLLIFPLVGMMAGMGLGLGIIISSTTTKYRDFAVLVGFAVQLLMYATPVVYPMSTIHDEKTLFWVSLNPLGPVVEGFRYAVLGTGSVTFNSLMYSFMFMTVTLVAGLLMFSRVERTFMDTV